MEVLGQHVGVIPAPAVVERPATSSAAQSPPCLGWSEEASVISAELELPEGVGRSWLGPGDVVGESVEDGVEDEEDVGREEVGWAGKRGGFRGLPLRAWGGWRE
eukprot:CAMPEP_0196592868 /NCGR_PEP_ID=MMETSP1081-20130531/74068_1 /TAXON_ID=36882 /ORGANISM="Pyramimonas amylifera, Strain CCMP720" /LENGTH=103 /DNA_ID=CAMNT_0041916681 /DNA_START=126 /DNA_END=438 /DNA_ORIENTATION=-